MEAEAFGLCVVASFQYKRQFGEGGLQNQCHGGETSPTARQIQVTRQSHRGEDVERLSSVGG